MNTMINMMMFQSVMQTFTRFGMEHIFCLSWTPTVFAAGTESETLDLAAKVAAASLEVSERILSLRVPCFLCGPWSAVVPRTNAPPGGGGWRVLGEAWGAWAIFNRVSANICRYMHTYIHILQERRRNGSVQMGTLGIGNSCLCSLQTEIRSKQQALLSV